MEVTLKQQGTLWKGDYGRDGQVKALTVCTAVVKPALQNRLNTKHIIVTSDYVKQTKTWKEKIAKKYMAHRSTINVP